MTASYTEQPLGQTVNRQSFAGTLGSARVQRPEAPEAVIPSELMPSERGLISDIIEQLVFMASNAEETVATLDALNERLFGFPAPRAPVEDSLPQNQVVDSATIQLAEVFKKCRWLVWQANLTAKSLNGRL